MVDVVFLKLFNEHATTVKKKNHNLRCFKEAKGPRMDLF
jgi:hypothetical protein